MFRPAQNKQKIVFDSLVFGRELVERPEASFKLSVLESLGFDAEVSCVAWDPLQSLLAVATQSGRITIYAKQGIPKCTWSIRPSQAVKHLVLKAGSPFVIVVDAKATLSVYDISTLDDRGEPARLFAHSLRSHLNCIEYVPSLSHVFLGCQDGNIDTFDVERLMISPYRIKNLWVDQDELLRRSGVLNAPPKRRIPACTDVKTHPLDPNQLLIGYEGGIALFDLTEQSLIRVYEYIVLPGAPGGHNDQTEDAFLERRPACTCLAWRPDGKVFASGYDDGSIVLWSIEDGDKPLMARTLSMEDVNLATSSNLFGDAAAQPSTERGELREPIFKLTWSSFTSTNAGSAKDGTILTVLGGLLPSDPKGLYTLHLHAYTPPAALLKGTPAEARDALRNSSKPMYTNTIPSDTPPEGFVLITSNPHYSQTSDPEAVFLLQSPDAELPKIAPHTERGFASFAFPPAIGSQAKELALPAELHLSGSQAVVLAEAITLPSLVYKRLKGEVEATNSYLPIHGGSTKSNSRLQAPRGKGPYHGLLTIHLDMSIRIWDHPPSSSLELLDTFSAREALSDDQLMAYLEGRVVIEKVSAAWETSEMAISLSTGEVVVFRFGYAKASVVLEKEASEQAQHYDSGVHASAGHSGVGQAESNLQSLSLEESRPNERRSTSGFFSKKIKSSKGKGPSTSSQNTSFEVDINDISSLSDWSKDGYKPVFSLSTPALQHRDRRIFALSLSDAGFLAVAWNERLAIFDLRGPEILYNEGSAIAEDGGITLLTWTVCAEGEDPDRHPKLLITYNSGLTRIMTLSFTLDTWIINSHISSFTHSSLQRPIGAFVMDTQGVSLDMTGSALDECLRQQERQTRHQPSHPNQLNTLLFMVSETSINIKANLTGDRLFKLDFPGTTRATSANVVRRYGMPVLFVTMQDGQGVVFSLPGCQAIKTLYLQYERARMSISPDGRLLQTLSPTLFQLSTIFTDQVPTPPKATYYDHTRVLPPQPTASYYAAAAAAATSYISSWFSSGSAGTAPASTNNLDDILAGPNRPAPRVNVQPKANPEAARQSLDEGPIPARPPRARPVAGASSEASSSSGGSKIASAASRRPAHQVEEVQYNAFGMPKKKHELTQALEERGERLDFLSDNLDKASKASSDFVNQARRMAMVQGGKTVISGGAKGAMAGIGKMFS